MDWDLHLALLLRGAGSRFWRWGTCITGRCGPPDLLLVPLDLLLNKNEFAEQTLLGYVIVRDRQEQQQRQQPAAALVGHTGKRCTQTQEKETGLRLTGSIDVQDACRSSSLT